MKSAVLDKQNYKFKINMKTKKSVIVLTSHFFILLISSFLLVSCMQAKSSSINENSKNRIKLKECININGYRYFIIEVDSVEFLTQDNGGFVRISK